MSIFSTLFARGQQTVGVFSIQAVGFICESKCRSRRCVVVFKESHGMHGGRSLVWDVTVVSPLAACYVDRAVTDAGTVADMAATRKTDKYSTLFSVYRFEPIAVENLGASGSSTVNLFFEPRRRISLQTGAFLFQRISLGTTL